MKTLGPASNFLAIDAASSSLERAAIAIVSAPYEHTVSYGGGTKAGPKAILQASAYVEFYDDETDRELCYDVGIATVELLVTVQVVPSAPGHVVIVVHVVHVVLPAELDNEL